MESIKEYLSGKTVFITGATGFLGQPLVEKILWSMPDVRKIYVLIRPKRQFGGRVLSAQERLEKELYGSSAFSRLQMRHGDLFEDFLREKLTAIAGDLSSDGLGIDPAERERLEREVDVFINSAAVVSFDAPLNEALRLNVMGALRLAEFARDCPNAILIHVSTAYVCGAARGDVEEELHHSADAEQQKELFPVRAFSDVDAEIAKIREIIEAVRQRAEDPELRRRFTQELLKRARKRRRRKNYRRSQEIENLRQRWLEDELSREGMRWARERGWNDTYTYTKALGEQLVYRTRGKLPVAIVRPSVIESSLSEPSPGWLDGLRMADPLIVAIGKGRLRSLPLNPDVSLDLVPADMVVNAILAVMPRVARRKDLEIIQVATSSTNPITLRELYELILAYFRGNPMLDKEGRPIWIKPLRFPSPTSFRIQHHLKTVPLNTAEKTLGRLPSFEAAQKARRRVSATRAAYEKLYYYGEIYEPYLNLNCRFRVDRCLELYEELTEADRQEFDFDVRRLNWRHYVQNVHIPGVKKFILKIEGTGAFELPEETRPDIPETIPQLLEQTVERFPNNSALQMKLKKGWVRYTFSQLREEALRVSARLQAAGLQKGDRVVLFSENRPEWGIAYLGASYLGVVVIPMDAQSWHREVWSVVGFTQARAILATEKSLVRFTQEELEKNEKDAAPVLLLDAGRMCEGFEKSEYPRSMPAIPNSLEPAALPELSKDDAASIIFTTGMSADPKGAIHTHASFLNNLRGVDRYLSISERDRLLSVLPLYHALEFTCGFLMPIYRGATITYAQSLKPRVILEMIRETKTTCMLGVPTLYALLREDIERRILKASKSPLKNNLMRTSKQISWSLQEHFGSNIGRRLFAKVHEEFGDQVRIFVSGGSALGRGLYRDFKSMGMPIYEGYGLTETAPVLTVNPLHRSRENSAGQPLPGVELRLFRPDREGVGEIIVRTPSLMQGYYGNQEATEAAVRDGWLHTGDLGWVDADGYAYITGRCKDVIVTGAGKNVYPTDLEAIYRTLPSVEELCVLGQKSGLTEDVHAVVVPAGDLSDLPPDEAKKTIQREIQLLSKELPSYHRLQAVHVAAEPLPRLHSGSLDREKIRDRILKPVEARPGLESKKKASGTSRREVLLEELSRLSGLDPEEITEESNLYTDLGLDSLMAVELLLFVEREMGVSISDEKVAGFQTVGDVFDELRRRGLSALPEGQPGSVEVFKSALPITERHSMDRVLLGASFSTLKMLFRNYFQLEVEKEAEIPQGKAYIVAANHSSHLDSAAVISALSLAVGVRQAQRIHVVGARDYFFNSPFKSWIFSTCLNVVPIERDEIGLSGVRMVGSILSRGEPVLIFPEGTRSRAGRIQDFRPGVGLLAWEYQAPILPVYIGGAHEAMPVGKSIPRRVPIHVRFGRLIEMSDYVEAAREMPRDELYRTVSNDLRNEIVALSREREPIG